MFPWTTYTKVGHGKQQLGDLTVKTSLAYRCLLVLIVVAPCINALESSGTYSATSNNISWYTGRWCHLMGLYMIHINPLGSSGNYSATPNNISWYTGRWWVGCYIWYSEEGTGRGRSPSRPLLFVPNVTAHPSTATVPITVLPYNGSLVCGFNVPVKG